MKILFNELKNYKISLLLILVATYISTIFELTTTLLLANAINIGIVANYGLKYIENIIFIMIIFFLISIILNILLSYLTNKISINIASNIRYKLFKKSLSLTSEEYNKFTNATLLTRTNLDVEQIKNFITSFLSIIFKAPILFISCITILKTINTSFSLVLLVAVTTLIIYLTIVIIKLIPLSKKTPISLDKLNNTLKEKLDGFKLIKSYNKLNKIDEKYKENNKEYLSTTCKVIKMSSFIMPVLNLIINSITIAILMLSISKIKNNTLEVGTIIATIQYIMQMMLSLIMVSMIILLIPRTKASIFRINEIMNSSSYLDNTNNLKLNVENITFKNISFKKQENIILNNINLDINKNDKIGIIGPTGSGKSALIKLLLKEDDTYNGTININNFNVQDLSRSNITSSITYVPSNPTILTGSILENILFSNPVVNNEELTKVIYTSKLTNFINNKKENLNYKLEENGANLSGGQKQRIALARALYANTSTIILDEPFSSLDYNSEKEIITNLNTFYNDKTLIIISQKISSIKHCNKIIVMDKGKIININTHEQLLKTCSIYKEMYETQKEIIEYDIH